MKKEAMWRVRKPAVAGYFYPSDKDKLISLIEETFKSDKIGPGKLPPLKEQKEAIGYLVPHAGYEYSGYVAAHAYLEISALPEGSTFIILGPNHYGIGSPIALPQSEIWETPLGQVKVDTSLRNEILSERSIIDMDDAAHWREHSIEVQIPYLQYIKKDFKILPISMTLMEKEYAVEVAEIIYKKIKDKKNYYIIASSDLTHYEPADSVNKKDEIAINAIIKKDLDEFYRVLRRYDITMCGYGPASVLIHLSNLMGYNSVKLLKHANSGDVTGDYSAVVGYASVGFYKS
ncbi:MAG: MEMO1 family protein [Nitrososphaeria archaeon]